MNTNVKIVCGVLTAVT